MFEPKATAPHLDSTKSGPDSAAPLLSVYPEQPSNGHRRLCGMSLSCQRRPTKDNSELFISRGMADGQMPIMEGSFGGIQQF
jgi:hypothetical protein